MVLRVVFAAGVLFLAGSCGDESRDLPEGGGTTLQVTSEAFGPGDPMPVEHTCDGQDVSPPLRWRGADVTEWVVVMRDPDADGFVHWLLYALPGEVKRLAAGDPPAEALQGANDFAAVGYRGPCPPEGDGPHTYEIAVYGLETESGLPKGATLQVLTATIEPLIIASGRLTATYER